MKVQSNTYLAQIMHNLQLKVLLYACYFDYKNEIIIYMDLKTYYIIFHDPLWIILLGLSLFFPIRHLIWILYVRKKQKLEKSISEEEKKNLKKRANFTSIFLSIVFSYIYVTQVFN